MTDEELAAWEKYARDVTPAFDAESAKGLRALVAEVRRLRALQCVRMVSGEEPLYCHEHGWVP